ncbi:hypothetical protein P692DRAFT_201932749 [Suillus brevipes Sb2]|nr:hypothetical protein P692DRAFT_201932749 [Suillus brevipes Sb2]
MDSVHPPVLIVGAGPVGLVAVLTLLQNGISVRIIDKDPHPHIGQRGAGIWLWSLELYNFLDVLEVNGLGKPAPPIRSYKPGTLEPLKESSMVPHVDPSPRQCYFFNSDIGGFHYGPGHPMKPTRIRMCHSLVMNYGLYKKMEIFRDKPATKHEMTQFHSDEYIEFLSRITPSNMNSYIKEQHKCKWFRLASLRVV